MKKKDKGRNFSDVDKFDRKQKKSFSSKEKGSSKHKFSIYNDYDDEDDLIDYSSDEEDDLDD